MTQVAAPLSTFDPNSPHSSSPTDASPRARGFLDEAFDTIKEDSTQVLDLFTGVSQKDAASNPAILAGLSREDRIALLVDGSTSSIFGSSPWSIGKQLDPSVATQIHASKGGTLAFAIKAGALDFAESIVRSSRYALVWDDAFISGVGNVSVNLIGQTFLILTLDDVPQGQTLTLWLTDDDLEVDLVAQGTKGDVDAIRKKLIGDVGAAAEKSGNPVFDAASGAFNAVTGFITTSQVGGIVALAVVGIVLVLVVRSEGFKDAAKAAAKVV